MKFWPAGLFSKSSSLCSQSIGRKLRGENGHLSCKPRVKAALGYIGLQAHPQDSAWNWLGFIWEKYLVLEQKAFLGLGYPLCVHTLPWPHSLNDMDSQVMEAQNWRTQNSGGLRNCIHSLQLLLPPPTDGSLKQHIFITLKNFVFYLEEYVHSFKNKFTAVHSHSVLLWAQFVSQAPVVIHSLVFK